MAAPNGAAIFVWRGSFSRPRRLDFENDDLEQERYLYVFQDVG